MTKTIVITGAGSGIGQMMAIEFSNQNYFVIIIGRDNNKLLKTKSLSQTPNNIIPLVADITNITAQKILNALPTENQNIDGLIHCAVTLNPVGGEKEVKSDYQEEFKYHMSTNVEAPINLTKQLAPHLTKGKVLFLGSYFAGNPISQDKWSACCYAYYYSKSQLKEEVDNLRKILPHLQIGYALPGAVNTGLYDNFWKNAEAHGIKKPDNSTPISIKKSASFLCKLFNFTALNKEEFSRKEGWDIKNPEDYNRICLLEEASANGKAPDITDARKLTKFFKHPISLDQIESRLSINSAYY